MIDPRRSCLLLALALGWVAPRILAEDLRPFVPSNLDRSVNPADDFYQYACGGWLARHSIPAEYSEWSPSEELIEINQSILRHILEDCVAQARDHAATGIRQQLGDFYATGMDEPAIEAQGIAPVQPWFDRIEAIKDTKDLAKVIGQLQIEGVSALFNLDGSQDQKNSANQIPVLTQGGLGLPERAYYFDSDPETKQIREAYRRHVQNMFILLGDTPEKAGIETERVMDLETALAKASRTPLAMRDPEANYHKMALEDLVKLAPQFPWATYFSSVEIPEIHLSQMDVEQPEFFAACCALSEKKSLEIWKSYLRWKLLHEVAPDLSERFVNEDFDFYSKKLTGTKELQPRWKRIVDATDRSLGFALGELYVEKSFSPAAKQRASEMATNIKAALREQINGLDWMGAQTKAAALRKLDALRIEIGYPDQWRDYSGLKITRQPFVLNVLAAEAFEMRRHLDRIGRPVDPNDWDMTPPTVNAEYDPTRNAVFCPAGILQPPFYDPNADDAVNYGATGATLGHEMTHGFDDQGRLYDLHGNLRNWWTPADARRFKEHGKRIVAQFDEFVPIDHDHLNGALTEGENIADLGGLKLALIALKKHLSSDPGHLSKIDGFSPIQRYFLAYAQSWETQLRPEALRLALKVDVHSPAKYRVIGPEANLPEFAAAFHLPPSCPMVRPPSKRPVIW